jgi:DNA-binding response OmpR family regulator
MKILLLEDELMLQSSIEEYLIHLGHVVTSFSRGDFALESLKSELYDILILDINVPHVDGFELLEYLRNCDILPPTNYNTALDEIEDNTKAITLGASDYLKKPFHLKELGLRLNNIAGFMDRQNRQHVVLSVNYSYSKQDSELYYFGKVQTLTKKQILILELLCHNIGMVLSFDKFRSYVWNHEPVDNATIRAEISRLRRVLKEDFIENIKGVGYKIERFIKT